MLPAPPDLNPLIESLSAAMHTKLSPGKTQQAALTSPLFTLPSPVEKKQNSFIVHLCQNVLHLNYRCPFGLLVCTYWLRLSFLLAGNVWGQYWLLYVHCWDKGNEQGRKCLLKRHKEKMKETIQKDGLRSLYTVTLTVVLVQKLVQDVTVRRVHRRLIQSFGDQKSLGQNTDHVNVRVCLEQILAT